MNNVSPFSLSLLVNAGRVDWTSQPVSAGEVPCAGSVTVGKQPEILDAGGMDDTHDLDLTGYGIDAVEDRVRVPSKQ